MFEMLEHVPNPDEMLEYIRQVRNSRAKGIADYNCTSSKKVLPDKDSAV